MSLLNYWPTVIEVDNCIKSQAESASDEVLLAVHQQFPLAFSKVGPDGRVMGNKEVATEDDLLRELLKKAPEGSLVLPITGASGVGKSHLIRLLDARLRRLPDARRYLVIRIPKSSSLRRVVELILEAEPLRDPKYDTIKVEFGKALADVPLENAVILFQSQLNISLNDLAGELKQKLRQYPTDSPTKEKLNHALKLPKLLADAETVEHFHQNIFPRIIQRAVVGVGTGSGQIREVDPTDSQFKADDFDLSSVNIGKAAIQVQDYYKLALLTRGGHGMSVAADVLNAVVDQATRQLYQLNESLGGMTLGEVILEIRRLLLADDRELVVLVEDFAALVGIQDTLAKVLIQEGTTSRGHQYATIRSAIAVTDGYLAGRETLATRAGREWVVESHLDSLEESLRRTRLLVASYLNAARFGEAELKTFYGKKFDEPQTDGKWCVPVFTDENDEDEEALKAFGYEGAVPLFPFTEEAIESLARSALTSGNALVFNPRFVIKNVIREILISGRAAFMEKRFPPPEIQGMAPSTEVAQWLDALGASEEKKQRYRRLVTIWGNNPQCRDDVGCIPPKIFEVFGLPKIDIEPRKRADSSKDKVPDKGKEQPRPFETDARTKAVEDINNTLENWVQKGVRLDQKVANMIRQALASLINPRIDWNAERCLKREVKSGWFSIPNASGEGGLAANAVSIASDSQDQDGRLRGELLALLRYCSVYERSADYEGADEDLARIANLLDRLIPEVLVSVRASLKNQTEAAILALAANSRLLGASERGRSVAAVSSFLFGEVEAIEDLPDDVPQAFREWRSMQRLALQFRQQVRQLLLETCGCFQGTGKTVNGVDIIRLVESYPEDGVKMELADLGSISEDFKQYLRNVIEARVNSRINQVLQEAKKVTFTIQEQLGPEFDKNVVADALKALAEKLRMGAWSTAEIGFTAGEFAKSCEAFRASALKECLAVLQKVEEPGAEDEMLPGKKICRVAQLSLLPLTVTQSFLEKATKVVKSANKHAQSQELLYQGVTPVEKAQEITVAFEDLLADLAMLQAGGK